MRQNLMCEILKSDHRSNHCRRDGNEVESDRRLSCGTVLDSSHHSYMGSPGAAILAQFCSASGWSRMLGCVYSSFFVYPDLLQ